MSPESGQTTVYSVHGVLMADQASDALISFAVENFVDLVLWSEIRGPMRPREMPDWMNEQAAKRCILFAVHDLYTPTQKVIGTPKR